MGTAAVILAAGASSRFGSPKQLATLDGQPMLQHVIDTITEVPQADPVVVVLGAHHEAILERIDEHRARVAICLGWDEGLAASLRAGVAAAREMADIDRVLVVLGDTPRLETTVVAEMLEAAATAPPGVAVRATYAGRPGYPVVLPRQLLDAVEELTGDDGAHDLVEGGAMLLIDAGGPGGMGVDTPAELEALR